MWCNLTTGFDVNKVSAVWPKNIETKQIPRRPPGATSDSRLTCRRASLISSSPDKFSFGSRSDHLRAFFLLPPVYRFGNPHSPLSFMLVNISPSLQ